MIKAIFSSAFWKGFGSVLDIFGTSGEPIEIDIPQTDEEAFAADAKALKSDWEAVLGKPKETK